MTSVCFSRLKLLVVLNIGVYFCSLFSQEKQIFVTAVLFLFKVGTLVPVPHTSKLSKVVPILISYGELNKCTHMNPEHIILGL